MPDRDMSLTTTACSIVTDEPVAAVSAAADEIEETRRLPGPLTERLAAAGLFRLLVPRAVGGEEVDLRTFTEAIELIAAADASTAWCLYQCGVTALAVALCLAPDAVDAVFSNRSAIVASGAGEGTAGPVRGGHRVSGSWGFASGIHRATWVAANMLDRAGFAAGGPLTGQMYVVPVAAAKVTDEWHVSGLRGTGSDGYSLHEVFVPTSFAAPYTPLDPLPGGAPVGALATGIRYGVGVAAVAMGVASASLQALVDLAALKRPRAGVGILRDRPAAQAAVGRSATMHAAARSHLYACIDLAWREAENGAVSAGGRVALRGAIVHAIESATYIVDAMYTTAGASAIHTVLPFERRFRDMHAVTQHPQASASHFEVVGRLRLGHPEAVERI
jgi:indole-3-acetate monooxygenase